MNCPIFHWGTCWCMCMRVGRHLCYSIFSWLPFKIPMCVRERTCGCLLRLSEHLEGSLLSMCSISSWLPSMCERELVGVYCVCEVVLGG